MKLRREYEPIRVNLMSRIPSPSLETCFAELFREEQRCVTQSVLENKNHQRANPMEIAYATQAKVRDMSKVQCYSCKEYGHIANYCKKNFCNYCKKSGHLIAECRRRPQNRTSQALHVSHSSSTPGFDSGSISSSGMTNITPEVVQQLIYSALSTLGISGTATHSHVCYIDSGASNHMVSSPKSLVNVKPSLGNLEIQTANGDKLPVKAIGDIPHSLPLNNVFLVPHLTSNLLSVGQLVDENCKVSFSPSGCIVQDQRTGKVIGMGPKCGRLFPLRLSVYPDNKSLFSLFSPVSLSQVWHKRLGHPNSRTLLTLLKSGLFLNKSSITSLDLSFACDSCKLGKSKTLPFPIHQNNGTKCFDLIHTDVWGKSPFPSHSHHKYFVSFIDDYSRHTWLYFLHSKSEVFEVFKSFLAYVKNQFSTSIKILRSDFGGEYMSDAFKVFLQSEGILFQKSCPDTPQQNGVAERKNRHLLDVTRTLLLDASVPLHFWVEALSTSVHLINRLPSPVLDNETPYFRLYSNNPDYNHLRVFGCLCYAHLPSSDRNKLTAQSARCAFLGYASDRKGYLCYDPLARRIRISRNVVFVENIYFFQHVSDSSTSSSSYLPNFDQLENVRFNTGIDDQHRENS
ncbi:retrovirus-related Pol polyprotein from transposon RE1 isoform X3 [Ziziphus jujuba]|uniref:Retrovirus-related Pol polyprotein from transposon RE1 isoform X3 n=1 Tax=Ziziphus jujuba TaxID=326968 RepID=A0ABM3ZZT1_ZIZJJ|nr:retrovirus-related Pol polyprotein from transposon RE1 isoform X3 [Ziziphus jujuba]